MRYILVFSLLALIVGAACTPRRDIGNTLRVAQREKIKTLDPAHANDFFSGTAVRRTYEGLYQYHYLNRPYEVVPNIAAAMPAISADGKTYTIRLLFRVRGQNRPGSTDDSEEAAAGQVWCPCQRHAWPRLRQHILNSLGKNGNDARASG